MRAAYSTDGVLDSFFSVGLPFLLLLVFLLLPVVVLTVITLLLLCLLLLVLDLFCFVLFLFLFPSVISVLFSLIIHCQRVTVKHFHAFSFFVFRACVCVRACVRACVCVLVVSIRNTGGTNKFF